MKKNAAKPESVPYEPDFEVNVDSPLAKLMGSLSAEPCVRSKRSYEGIVWGGDDFFTNLRKVWGTNSVLDALYEILIKDAIPVFINNGEPATAFLPESKEEYEDSLYEVGFQLRKAYPEFEDIPWKEEYDDYAIFNYCRFY